MADRDQLLAKLKAAAWEMAAALGSNAAQEALDQVKREIGDSQWRRR